MSKINGFIAKISVKEGYSKRGPWKLYSIKLEKEDGTEFEKWLSAGFDAPKVREGDYVTVEYHENDKGYLDIDSIKSVKNAPARGGSSNTGSGGKAAGSGVGQTTQQSIHYQSSRNAAIQVLEILQQNNALPLSQAKTKAGDVKRYEEIMALVDKLTVRFYNDVETLRVLKVVADEGAVASDVGELPEDEDDEVDATPGDDDETDDE